MKTLFLHQNYPGQYLHIARHVGARFPHQSVFVTQRLNGSIPGIRTALYKPRRAATSGVHHYVRDAEACVLNAQEVYRTALDLKANGFAPDLILGHNGWGEIWYLKEVFPKTPLIGYFEFFYRLAGADVGFDPTERVSLDTGPRLRTKNVGNLLGLDAVDWGQCPTQWQKSLYPSRYHPILKVMHEGIDTRAVAPDPRAVLTIPDTEITVQAGDEIVTYVARNLEPYRGFPSFMRSLPDILSRRPSARVLIVGGDETSYGPPPSGGQSYRAQLLAELAGSLDPSRVHFLGKVSYALFLKILQVSRVHIYLTLPFVLSWSMLEAMSAGCVVVGSRTAPVEEVIADGDNGLLVDMLSPATVAERAIDVLEHPEAYARIRHRARQSIIEQYDLRSICLPAQLRWLSTVVGRRLD